MLAKFKVSLEFTPAVENKTYTFFPTFFGEWTQIARYFKAEEEVIYLDE